MNIFIKDIAKYIDKEVSIRGWVFNMRSSGKIAFLQVRDGTGFLQAIAEEKTLKNEQWKTISKIIAETPVEITGKVSKHPKKDNEYELHVTDVKVFQIPEEYPIGKKEHGPEFLLDNRHLWMRSKRQWAVLRIRSAIYKYIEEWLNLNGFTRFDSPIFTPTACEGTTTLFGLDYFDLGEAYLSQSGQLYLEAGTASLGRFWSNISC
jgi:asparaginyl-tRNA synthetase